MRYREAKRLLVWVLIGGGFVLGFFLYQPAPTCSSARHYSYFSSRSFFDTAYNRAGDVPPDSSVRGVIVNHHLLAADLIADTIGRIATTKPVTVILLSPNHFSVGDGPLISSEASWETPYGVLPSDCELVRQLRSGGLLNIDERPFGKEHGVSGIVAFIRRSLPAAKIVPIIIKDSATDQEIDNLAVALYSLAPRDTLLIGSFDFSHYVDHATAMSWDEDSIRAIENFDYLALKGLHLDSRPGLRLMLKLLEAFKAKTFTITAHTDADQLLGNLQSMDNTSYIDGVFK